MASFTVSIKDLFPRRNGSRLCRDILRKRSETDEEEANNK
jgi:hypothetical protein